MIDRTLFSKVDQTNAHGRHRKFLLAGMPALKWAFKRITITNIYFIIHIWGHRLCPIAGHQFYTPSVLA